MDGIRRRASEGRTGETWKRLGGGGAASLGRRCPVVRRRRAPPPLPPKDRSKEQLPAGWEAHVDPESGDTYYHNEATGVTTWDKPGDSSLTKL